jgi:Domain of unknown function (DUF4398)
MMKNIYYRYGILGLSLAVSAATTGCGATYPVPTQRMADAQSAYRSAQELGADKLPTAELHLKLAEEQIKNANTVLKEDENRRADFMLIRAKADAELALALAHENKSKIATQQAVEQSNAQSVTNANQGARQ